MSESGQFDALPPLRPHGNRDGFRSRLLRDVLTAVGSPAVGALIGFVIYLVVLPLAAYHIDGGAQHFWMSVAVLALGGATGWLLGVAASPYNTDEGKRFARIIGAVAIFGSGYVAARADKLLDTLLSLAYWKTASDLEAFRVAAFLTIAISSMLYVYAKRTYMDRSPKDESEPPQVASTTSSG